MRFLDEVKASIPALWRFAFGLTGDRDRADDLVQDCIERSIRAILLSWICHSSVTLLLRRVD